MLQRRQDADSNMNDALGAAGLCKKSKGVLCHPRGECRRGCESLQSCHFHVSPYVSRHAHPTGQNPTDATGSLSGSNANVFWHRTERHDLIMVHGPDDQDHGRYSVHWPTPVSAPGRPHIARPSKSMMRSLEPFQLPFATGQTAAV